MNAAFPSLYYRHGKIIFLTSYFVGDAIRCIDYAATRAEADRARGVAMTGVSGGGTTTTFAALLDDRITVIGPSCCVTPLADLDISQCYAGCPETHMFRRYADGIDEVDLICDKPDHLKARIARLAEGQRESIRRLHASWRRRASGALEIECIAPAECRRMEQTKSGKGRRQ